MTRLLGLFFHQFTNFTILSTVLAFGKRVPATTPLEERLFIPLYDPPLSLHIQFHFVTKTVITSALDVYPSSLHEILTSKQDARWRPQEIGIEWRRCCPFPHKSGPSLSGRSPVPLALHLLTEPWSTTQWNNSVTCALQRIYIMWLQCLPWGHHPGFWSYRKCRKKNYFDINNFNMG